MTNTQYFVALDFVFEHSIEESLQASVYACNTRPVIDKKLAERTKKSHH